MGTQTAIHPPGLNYGSCVLGTRAWSFRNVHCGSFGIACENRPLRRDGPTAIVGEVAFVLLVQTVQTYARRAVLSNGISPASKRSDLKVLPLSSQTARRQGRVRFRIVRTTPYTPRNAMGTRVAARPLLPATLGFFRRDRRTMSADYGRVDRTGPPHPPLAGCRGPRRTGRHARAPPDRRREFLRPRTARGLVVVVVAAVAAASARPEFAQPPRPSQGRAP